MLGEEDAVVGLLQGAPVMLLTAQVPCRDREEVLLCLLIRIVLGLVVQENPQDGCHHAQDVGAGDRVPQHDQGHRDDHDSLGGVGDRVAQRADEVEDAEGNDVLGKVTEATDSQKQERPGPLGHIGLQTGARQHHGHMPALAEAGRAAEWFIGVIWCRPGWVLVW